MGTYSIGHIDTPLGVINSHNLHTIRYQTPSPTFQYNLYSNAIHSFGHNCAKDILLHKPSVYLRSKKKNTFLFQWLRWPLFLWIWKLPSVLIIPEYVSSCISANTLSYFTVCFSLKWWFIPSYRSTRAPVAFLPQTTYLCSDCFLNPDSLEISKVLRNSLLRVTMFKWPNPRAFCI